MKVTFLEPLGIPQEQLKAMVESSLGELVEATYYDTRARSRLCGTVQYPVWRGYYQPASGPENDLRGVHRRRSDRCGILQVQGNYGM